jgi:hypothetical protein
MAVQAVRTLASGRQPIGMPVDVSRYVHALLPESPLLCRGRLKHVISAESIAKLISQLQTCLYNVLLTS